MYNNNKIKHSFSVKGISLLNSEVIVAQYSLNVSVKSN